MNDDDIQDSLLHELARFLAEEKRWWLTPLVGTLGALSALIVLAEGSAVAPFVYALF